MKGLQGITLTADQEAEIHAAMSKHTTKIRKVDPRGTKRSQALPGQRSNVFRVMAGDLMVIEDKSDPLYDPRIEEPISDEFLASCEAEGVQVPILVAKVDRFTKPVVIDGKQRWRATMRYQNDGRGVLPAILVKGDDRALFALMILTNENRRDDTQEAKCHKVRRFVELYTGGIYPNTNTHLEPVKNAMSQAAIAFGVTTKTIEARLKFFDLAPVVQDAVAKNEIPFWAATEFAGATHEAQGAMLENVKAKTSETGKRPSVETAKRAAGKGKSEERASIEESKKSLLEAAIEFARHGKKEFTIELHNAAKEYFKAVNQPTIVKKVK